MLYEINYIIDGIVKSDFLVDIKEFDKDNEFITFVHFNGAFVSYKLSIINFIKCNQGGFTK